MDILSEGERQKRYYQGLKKASEYHLPDEDELMTAIRENQIDPEYDGIARKIFPLLCNVVWPLNRIFLFIINNRLVHESTDEFAEQAKENPVMCTPDDIFLTLCSVEPYAAEEIIRTIDTDSATLERLRQCYLERNRQSFVAAVKENRCGLQTISLICKRVWPDIPESNSQPINDEDLAMSLDAFAVTNTKDLVESAQTMLRSVERLSDEMIKTMEDGGGDDRRCLVAYYECIRDIFVWQRDLYTCNIKLFKPRERRIIENILSRPETLTVPLAQVNDGDGFTLPANYFSLISDLSHVDEHFNLRHDVITAGPDCFTELINYLSECGYIENSLAVKQLFAYRFSGRMRPEMVVSIEWHGRNDKSYELIYLVRNLCPRGDYVKMKRFFFGPDWVKIDDSGYSRDSCYSKDADRDLKEYLKKLYPTIPDQL